MKDGVPRYGAVFVRDGTNKWRVFCFWLVALGRGECLGDALQLTYEDAERELWMT